MLQLPKETNMLYKTIALELLQQNPPLYERLCRSRTLLPALEAYAKALKASHEEQKLLLAQANPGSDPAQIASEAMEIAVKELEDSLLAASPPDDPETLSLEAAMAFLRRPTPPA
jgi:hypothetical protein